ncbi:MAG: arylsulfatase [candidate division KSB1 bacterium]|nr:arylsulfatase [candidate division KSB1 bacterium]
MKLSRRRFIKSAAALSATFFPGLVRSCRSQPNIVLVVADDLGYGDLSCYGQKKFETPNLDRMAAEGMRFTQHYSGSTVCAPSRCCLMTGMHTGHAQIRGNKEIQPIGQYPLKAGTLTLARLLQQAGYKTGMFGKWGLGYPGSSGDPLNQGFDTFFGYNCQRNAHSFYPSYLYHDKDRVPLDGQTYSHDLIIEKAFEFIKNNQDNRFFCYLPVTIPHASMHAPPDLHCKWRKKLPQFDDVTADYGGPIVRNPVAAFPAMVTHLDNQIGSLFPLLKKLNLDNNTLVLFTSDNGPHQEGGHRPDFWDSNGSFSGYKQDLLEGGIRTPLIARWPGQIPAGSISEHVCAFWDYLPTLADFAGVQAPSDIDGISMRYSLLQWPVEKQEHSYLYWESRRLGGQQAIRYKQYKGIRRKIRKDVPSPVEIYNLETDPAEQNDISDEHPELILAFRTLFKTARTPSKLFPLFEYEKEM